MGYSVRGKGGVGCFPSGLQRSHHVGGQYWDENPIALGPVGIYTAAGGFQLESLDNLLVLENPSGSRSIDHTKEG